MMEELNLILEMAEEAMNKAVDHLDKSFINIRAGKANPVMLSTVKVDYYGSQTPLSQVANINTPDGQTLSVQPWEKPLIPEIEKAILVANLGFNPMNNGESIIISIPPLTEERRCELVKLAKSEAEHAKVGVRNARKDSNAELKKIELSEDELKNAEVDVQEATDKFITLINDKYMTKEKEIMTV
ncbi:MAG: ribosome recycling factor [Flavobacteriaceae bacterium]